MCRNIRTLSNFEPPANEAEISASALQFVRKISGYNKPTKANQAVFDQAVNEVSATVRNLLNTLVINAAPRNRDQEAARARARNLKRFGVAGSAS